MPLLKSITEVQDNRGSTVSIASGDVGTLSKSNYKRCWAVEFDPTDVVSDGADAVLAVPVGLFDVYLTAAGGVDYASYCGSIDAVQYKAPWVWMVTASYSSDVDLSNPTGDPLLMPPVFSWGDKTATRPATTYNDAGDEVAQLNSAGDPIDPPITDEESWTTLKITRNFASFDPIKAASYKNTVNGDAFLGFLPGEVLCTGISADSDTVKGVIIWKVVGSFEIKREGGRAWAVQVLDRGFQGFDGSGTKRVFVDQATGRALTGASLLDGTGKQLARNATPVYQTFNTKVIQVFANIGLP